MCHDDDEVLETISSFSSDEVLESAGASPELEGEWLPMMDTSAFEEPDDATGGIGLEQVFGRDNRLPVRDTTVAPFRSICHISFLPARDNRTFGGTGWLISPRVVITAAHVVWDKKLGNNFSRNVAVYSGRNGSRFLKSSRFQSLHVVSQWANASAGRSEYDFAAIVLKEPIGSDAFFTPAVKGRDELLRSRLYIVGYPVDKRDNRQWGHANRAATVEERLITYLVDTSGGQSGACVMVKKGDSYEAVGIHNAGSDRGNIATRITDKVFNKILEWKALGE